MLQDVTYSLRRRGPDVEGLLLRSTAGLCHRRQNFIGLATGDQLMSNEDSSVWAVFNGDILNLDELRRALQATGHVICTQSDPAVIVHQYDEDGVDCLLRLRGMFPFAVELFIELLVQIVRLRLRSDVSFGAFLSGGAVSTSVVAPPWTS
jgi:asparagine synthase (glutamine-hydrolysing)